MIADRPYRLGATPAAARDELLRCSGSQFDPEVVDAFIGTLGIPEGLTQDQADGKRPPAIAATNAA